MGNYITDNRGPGVLADARGGDAVIGYAAESDGAIEDVNCRDTRCNRIENNQGAGVRVAVASQITVRGNRMRGNTGLDVDLAGPGRHRQRRADADDWPNTPTGVAADQGERRPVGAGSAAGSTASTPQQHADRRLRLQRPRRRSRAARAAASTSAPRSRTRAASGSSRPAKTYAAYGAVMTDRHGNTSELSPLCTGDQDGDALCDNWETGGIDYDADGTPRPAPAGPGRRARSSPTSSSRSTGRRAASRT